MRNRNFLCSVWKDDREDPKFAASIKAIAFHGHAFYASGGTAGYLRQLDVPVTDIATLIGGKAILGHRVVTISREVGAGFLARYVDADLQEMEKLGLPYMDGLIGTLYPLTSVIASGASRNEVIEATDIGGILLLRSAAKGRRIIAASLGDLERVSEWLRDGTLPTSLEGDIIRECMAAKAERIAELYCRASADYAEKCGRELSERHGLDWDELLDPIKV